MKLLLMSQVRHFFSEVSYEKMSGLEPSAGDVKESTGEPDASSKPPSNEVSKAPPNPDDKIHISLNGLIVD